MNDQDILLLIGIRWIEYHKKYKEIKTIEELAKDMLNPTHPLYFLYNHKCIHTCFPMAHIITEGNTELAENAFKGKGMINYAEMIKNRNTASTIPGIDTLKTPFYDELADSDVSSLAALNEADHGSSCPNASNCAYLKILKEKIVGRPCPFFIKTFIKNLVYFTDVFVINKREIQGIDNLSIDDLSPSEKIAVATEAANKTRAEFLTSLEATKASLKWNKDGFEVTQTTNDSNKQANDILKNINDSLSKRHGIDKTIISKHAISNKYKKELDSASKSDKVKSLIFNVPIELKSNNTTDSNIEKNNDK